MQSPHLHALSQLAARHLLRGGEEDLNLQSEGAAAQCPRPCFQRTAVPTGPSPSPAPPWFWRRTHQLPGGKSELAAECWALRRSLTEVPTTGLSQEVLHLPLPLNHIQYSWPPFPLLCPCALQGQDVERFLSPVVSEAAAGCASAPPAPAHQ